LAFAESTQNESRLQLEQQTRPRTGTVLVVVFEDGAPKAGVRVQGEFGSAVTREDGSVVLSLAVGRQGLVIGELGEPIQAQVVENQETEVSVHLIRGISPEISVLEPSAQSTGAEGAVQEKVLFLLSLLVREEGDSRGIADATVVVSGQDSPFKTDGAGVARMNLRAGTYSILIFHSRFQTHTEKNVVVGPAMQTLQIALKPTTNELEEVMVLAPRVQGSVSALVEVRRKSSSVTEVLGADQMARQGDSDAAAALRRVTGLTLVNGKYVYVRGLGERYSSVQMNSFSLPSPEPARRVVPMDLFPASILESVVVQKSYSPELPGEFGGGVIQLQTRGLPDRFFFKGSLSANLAENQNRLTYHGGSTDWLGRDDGTRAMPKAIRAALASGAKLVPKQPGSAEGISEEELTQLGRSLPNQYSTFRTSKEPLPNLSLAMGDRFSLGEGVRLGTAGSILYGQVANEGRRLDRGLNAISPGRFTVDYEKQSEYSEVETRVAANLDLDFHLGKNHRLNASTFLLRHTTDLVQQDQKQVVNSPSSLESTALEWTERQLWTKHLRGEHKLSGIEARWRVGLSDAERQSPDRRDYTYERTANSYQMRGDSGGNRRTYSELTDSSKEVGLDLTVPIVPREDRLKLKLGASWLGRERRSDVFRLYFAGGPINGLTPEQRFAPGNIGPGGFELRNITDAADSYGGNQNVNAVYSLLEFNPVKRLTLHVGVRRESSLQKVSTFKYYEPQRPFSTTSLQMVNWLPSYGVVYKPSERWRFRMAYSETLARPDFRELSEVGFIDDETGNEVVGNSKLKGAVIRNVDHRTEFYLTSDEYVSVGAFYKKFENPIEVMFLPGVNRVQTFDNAKAAHNYGLEFEGRMGLRHASRGLRRWSVLSNLTLISSRIELDERSRGIQTSDKRPLQGQSPYVVNAQLQYDRPLWGFSSTLLYNIIGKRITEVGTNEVPDTYEQPFHQLDWVASQKFAKNWSFGLRARNLLDPKIQAKQSDFVVRSTRYGRTLGLSVTGTF